MSTSKGSKLNNLLVNWQPGSVYTATWLSQQGFSSSAIAGYCQSNWLRSISRGAFVKVGDNYDWSGGIWSVQHQLGLDIHPGAKTALELAGYGHFLPLERQSVMLFGATGVKLPHWLQQQAEVWKLQYFTTNLFAQEPLLGLTERRFGELDLKISTPERASLEMLYLVPYTQSIEEAWLLMEGLVTLRPRLVQSLLVACNSIKVRRLFLYFAEQHQHPWFDRLDIKEIDLGVGNRSIVSGGRLDPKYHITVPTNLGLN
jgi:Transcriptional regulator, AbiEi antitoxin, Type IV TA system/Transcriptional regulator, AbiEi antitoxin N-terminal domain